MSKNLINSVTGESYWMNECSFWESVHRAEAAGFKFRYVDYEGTGFGCLLVSGPQCRTLAWILKHKEVQQQLSLAEGLARWCEKCKKKGWNVMV